MKRTLLSLIPLVGLGALQWGCLSETDDGTMQDVDGTGNASFGTGGVTPSGSGGGTNLGSGGVVDSGAGGQGQSGVGGGAGGTWVGPGSGGASNPGGGGAAGGGAPGSGGADSGGGGTVGAGGADGAGGTDMGTGGSPPVPEPSLVTSSQGSWWQEGEVTEGGGNPNVTVNVNDEHQTWHGFGGTFNEAGWDALKAVSEADRDLAIRLLFHPHEGAGFTFGRIPIGSSDYGLSRYSLNETAGDVAMTNFSIERDQKDLIPYIKAALAQKPDIRFWASPWSPPTWMKSPQGFDGGAMKDDDNTLKAHAEYLVRFVEEYDKVGIKVEAVHPQNEPGYTQGYPSCSWSAGLFTKYIADYLGPLMASRLPDREIWLGTMSNTTSTSIVSSVMGNQTARGYVKGIGLQWGMVASASNYAGSYTIPIMQTEHQCGNNPWEGHDQSRAPNDHAYAVESWGRIKQWINAGVNSYLAWNMVLDTVGHNLDTTRVWAQNALIAVDRGQGRLIPTPTYYVFRHLAQFVEPNSVRVGTQGGDALAWKNPDGSVVAVIYNSGGATQMTISIGGTNLQFQAPGQGWATINWQG